MTHKKVRQSYKQGAFEIIPFNKALIAGENAKMWEM